MADTPQMQRARYCAKKYGYSVRKLQGKDSYIISNNKTTDAKILSFIELKKFLVGLKIDELKNLSAV